VALQHLRCGQCSSLKQHIRVQSVHCLLHRHPLNFSVGSTFNFRQEGGGAIVNGDLVGTYREFYEYHKGMDEGQI
ncbi:hypothetical protein, partial [Paenibacillus graminis]|uniref:hypothetical protein n=1 Tax=Paenibacillus graminis TaxID=189425 RepID=UPI0030C8F88A